MNIPPRNEPAPQCVAICYTPSPIDGSPEPVVKILDPDLTVRQLLEWYRDSLRLGPLAWGVNLQIVSTTR